MSYTPPEHERLQPLYCDEHLLAVDKPAGLLSVPGRGEDKQDCLLLRIREDYPEALIVHRLDMATSGLLLLARNADCHRQLGRLFEQREIEKTYIALIDGRPQAEDGRIDLPLITDWPNRPRQKVDWQQGRPAITDYRLLDYDTQRDVSRIELHPKTGRSHQLRVHMQAIGHPILGDPLYAGAAACAKASRLMLHAISLAFTHPMTGQALKLTCKTPF